MTKPAGVSPRRAAQRAAYEAYRTRRDQIKATFAAAWEQAMNDHHANDDALEAALAAAEQLDQDPPAVLPDVPPPVVDR